VHRKSALHSSAGRHLAAVLQRPQHPHPPKKRTSLIRARLRECLASSSKSPRRLIATTLTELSPLLLATSSRTGSVSAKLTSTPTQSEAPTLPSIGNMTMAIDQQQRHHLGGLPLDHMPYSAAPQFSNPWAATTGPPSTHMYTTPQTATFPQYSLPKQQDANRTMSLPYTSGPGSAHYAPGPLPGPDMHPSQADMRSPYDQAYTSGPPHSASYASQSATFPPINSFSSPQEHSRPSPLSGPPVPTQAFGEALDGARGMVAMSQTDITPRNIYGPRGDRGSTDSYGFPGAHSAHSSISSTGGYPAYFGGSVDSSATDYSSAAESIDSLGSRTLPRPNGLMGATLPPVQQSMMGSFNSKVSSSTQKKHKCKVCDKRFTRPSSLQTHMYSHTGEKREYLTSFELISY
jgi:Zinc-finger of C2H2 type